MDIAKIISENLTRWMAETPSLDTLQKVEAKAGVGFGTIRRAKKGEGNITVEKLAAIAAAFGRDPAELMTVPAQQATAKEPAARYDAQPELVRRYQAATPAVRAVVDLALARPGEARAQGVPEAMASAVATAILIGAPLNEARDPPQQQDGAAA